MSPRRATNSRSEPLDEPGEHRYSQSLARGLAILESFTAENNVRGLVEISDEVGIGRSTTHRYIVTLQALGYVEQDPGRKYRLGLRVTDLGMAALNANDLRERAHPILQELRDRTRLTASLAVREEDEILYLDRVPSRRRGGVDAAVGVGSRRPAHSTALGKVLLANAPREELDEILSATRLRRMTPNTIVAKRALRTELERVRDEGFASEDRECAPEIVAIAVPVYARNGDTAAAIALDAAADSLDAERLAAELAAPLLAAAERVSTEIAAAEALNARSRRSRRARNQAG
ncbi:MAG TPA: IclR family transcriptional regulator [Solirubrobacteraceae bacterium]|nr:IclR family transcriptional regulator [Solirubrobacteraceae bacterium]